MVHVPFHWFISAISLQLRATPGLAYFMVVPFAPDYLLLADTSLRTTSIARKSLVLRGSPPPVSSFSGLRVWKKPIDIEASTSTFGQMVWVSDRSQDPWQVAYKRSTMFRFPNHLLPAIFKDVPPMDRSQPIPSFCTAKPKA